MTLSTSSVVIAIVAVVPPTITALAALKKTKEVSKKVEELHVIVNSRLTELLEVTKRAATSEGFAAGVKESEQFRSTPSQQE